jgi:hypothetical protein
MPTWKQDTEPRFRMDTGALPFVVKISKLTAARGAAK